MHPGTHIQLAQNMLYVDLDGGFCNAKFTAYFFVAGALANGPQMPGAGTSQADIDKLLASFD